jgi:hypothetical protein
MRLLATPSPPPRVRVREKRYPLFACRSKRKRRRAEKRKEINAVVMKYECPINPPNLLTNARLRVASKIKYNPVTNKLEKAGHRPISTGGSGVGSSGWLAVTDVFKLLYPELDPIYREL